MYFFFLLPFPISRFFLNILKPSWRKGTNKKGFGSLIEKQFYTSLLHGIGFLDSTRKILLALRCPYIVEYAEGPWESDVKTPRSSLGHFCSLLSAEFWRHCVLGDGTQRRALPFYQSEKMKILNISFPRVGQQSRFVCNIMILNNLT